MNVSEHLYKYLTVIALMWFALFMSSCNRGKTAEMNIINIGDLKTMEMIRYDNTDFIGSYSLVKLELSDQSILGGIDQIQCFNDQLYILDRKADQLLVFNMDGTFSHSIGHMGRGPMEFLALNSFYINPERNNIVLFDPMGLKVVRYDLAGHFIDSRKPAEGVKLQGITNATYLGKGKILCYADPNGMMDEIMFTMNEDKLSIEDRIVTRPFNIDPSVHSMSKQQFGLTNDGLHFVKWFDNIVYSYHEGEIKPLFQIIDKPLVPKETLKSFATANSGSFSMTIYKIAGEGKYSAGLRNLYETDRFMIVHIPMISLLVYDKKTHEGVYIPNQLNTTVGLSDIIYSSGNTVICRWDTQNIQHFSDNLASGKLNAADFDDQIVNIVKTYDNTRDNPLLLVFKMKE